ncbi:MULTISPECIES: type II secretion system F family protein [unclassified Mumia]|uniref:type II secretion system F family protein n=1 Tax=unclassified Mumia TaxID=2621872 RepID=UPI001AB043B3|nr:MULTISPECIES: type II secretion system F family protein [unclassified Mumia]
MSLLAALLACLAVALAADDSGRARLRDLRAQQTAPTPGRPRPGWLTSHWFAGALAVVAVSQVVGGVSGMVLGLLAGAGVTWWVSRLEPAAHRRQREREMRDLPLALDLVVAAVVAGRPTMQVLAVVADAVDGPLGARLHGVVARLSLGADPAAVWRELHDDPVLAPLARAFARAARSGTAVRRVLERAADDLRAVQRAAALERARAVGVRTAAPLGACFLPAFLLLGVVPTVVATFASLDL